MTQDPLAAPISAAEVARMLPAGFLVELVERTGSTNSDLAARGREAALDRPVLRAAQHQEAGRGRLGRSWEDSAGESLLFSVGLPWPLQPGASAAVTLACAVELAHCLRALGAAVALKWPNDILLDGRKLAGILTELVEDASGARTLVVGVGMNLVAGALQRERIGHPVADLAQCLGRTAVLAQRGAWLGRLAGAVHNAATGYAAEGFAAYHEPFNQLLAWRGRQVEVRNGGLAQQQGIARGVDARGQLVLQCGDRELALAAGEVSLRAAGASSADTDDPAARGPSPADADQGQETGR